MNNNKGNKNYKWNKIIYVLANGHATNKNKVAFICHYKVEKRINYKKILSDTKIKVKDEWSCIFVSAVNSLFSFFLANLY